MRPRRPRGFTLLELLVVLAIAGLLLATVPPLVSAAMPGSRLQAAARELTVTLREARADAMARNVTVEVLLDTEAPRYAVAGRAATTLPRGTELRVLDEHAALPQPSTEPYRLRFAPDGSSNGAVIALRRGTLGYRVQVDWLMGRVQVTREDGNAI